MSTLDEIAIRHGVPVEAAEHLLDALRRGHGRMAQFNHSALGGMGQWHSGGMIMIGDMFNDALKAHVASLCAELAPLVDLAPPKDRSSGGTWPSDLGTPSSTGAQSDVEYAVFPENGRIAIREGGQLKLYDTLDYRINGASQQQSMGRDLTFESQRGTLRLHDLPLVEDLGKEEVPTTEANASRLASREELQSVSNSGPGPQQSHQQILETIQRLAGLHRKGVLDDLEYAAKKAELLARL